MKRGPKPRPPAERLRRFVTRGEPADCWEFTGCRLRGYGQLGVEGVPKLTHRIAWEEAHGPIPDGLWVLHHCDNPPCCNPAHLYLGTHADNMRDMAERGRDPGGCYFGEMNAKAKLTTAEVAEVRALAAGGVTQREIAIRFGVTQAGVSLIVRRKTRTRG